MKQLKQTPEPVRTLLRTWTVLSCVVWSLTACGPAYRTPVLFKDRVISQQKLGADDYAVYSAALPEFLPDSAREWIAVTGVTIPADPVDASLFDEAHRPLVEDLGHRLIAAGDTVHVIDQRFTEPPPVAVTPLMDTINWVPVQWHRTLHKSYPAGMVSFARVAKDPGRDWALVYGLAGKGPVGTGIARAILLQRQAGEWRVVESRPLD